MMYRSRSPGITGYPAPQKICTVLLVAGTNKQTDTRHQIVRVLQINGRPLTEIRNKQEWKALALPRLFARSLALKMHVRMYNKENEKKKNDIETNAVCLEPILFICFRLYSGVYIFYVCAYIC